MTIQEIMKDKGYSRYRLSKESGVPWATLSDICSGKTSMEKCSAGTLNKLAKALNMPMEVLFLATAESEMQMGLPVNQSYLETGLPTFLQQSIDEFVEGEENNVTHMDCLWGELYSAINACQWDNSITKEQADYLRNKYLFENEEEDADD